MKVPLRSSIIIAIILAAIAIAGVILGTIEPPLFGIPWNAYLSMALLAIGIITFFSLLGYGTGPEDMRTAIAGAIVTVYLVLVADVAFFALAGEEKLSLHPITETMITSFTTIVAIVIPFYFGASAYAQANTPRERSGEDIE